MVPEDRDGRGAGHGADVHDSVRAWIRAHASHWQHEHSDRELNERVEVVAQFCALAGESPDELVAGLFRPTPDGPRIRIKRRREVIAAIEEFEHSMLPEGPREARRRANLVRSFLIHNGVALTAGVRY